MSAKYTPGPWKAGLGLDHFASVQAESGCVAACYGGEVEATANARLIAAAPELLAALKDACASIEVHAVTARHYAEDGQNTAANIDIAFKLFRQALMYRAVIAKAEGNKS